MRSGAPANVANAVAVRESALGRVRLLTRASVATGLALTAVFTLIAAGSTHAKRLVVVRVRGRSRVTRVTHRAHVTAPVPPLVSASSSAASAEGDGSSAAPAAVQPPPAPAPADVTPVVVSGGS